MKSSPLPANAGQGRFGSRASLPLVLTLLLTCPGVLLAQTLPTVTSGTLFLHLQADAGVTVDGTGTNVTSWQDQSPSALAFNADVAVTSRGYPAAVTNGGVPFIRFATNSILAYGSVSSPNPIQLFSAGNSGLTLFAAFRTSKTNAQQYLVTHALPASGVQSVTMEWGPDPGAVGNGTFGLNRSGSSTVNANLNSTYTPTGLIVSNVLCVMSTVIKSTGYAPNNVEIYKNGVGQPMTGKYTAGTPLTLGWLSPEQYDTGNGGLFVGGRVNLVVAAHTADSFLAGDVGEIVIYQGELTPQDRAAVEAYLGTKYSVSVTTPPSLRISAQPLSQAVTNGDTATFSVTAVTGTNTDTISYQWQTNGVNLGGATTNSLTIFPVSAANVASYQCVVSIPSLSLTSRVAQLRLFTNTLPTVGSGALLVHLQADAGVTTSGDDVTSWADQSPNAFTFTADLITPTVFQPTLTNGITGNKVLHFEGASDLSATAAIQLFTDTNAPLTVFSAFSSSDPTLQRYAFNSKFPRPTGTRQFYEMMLGVNPGNQNAPGSLGIHRAASLATLTAANVVTNGEFTLLSTVVKGTGTAPNNLELYKDGAFTAVSLSSAVNNPADIPFHPGWLSAGEYPTGSYPLYVGTAADSSQTTFTAVGSLVGDLGELIIYQGQLSAADRMLVEQYLGQKYGINVTPPVELIFASQPQSVTITNGPGQSVIFTVGAVNGGGGTGGLVYQWQKNGVNIANATDSTYTISPAGLTDVASYRCLVSLSGVVTNTSAWAGLILAPDNTPPNVSLPAVSPGNLLVHLQADAGVTTSDGTQVTTWLDQSTNAFVFNAISHASPSNAVPILTTNFPRLNSVIRFNGTNNNVLCPVPFQLFAYSNSPVTIFTAFRTFDNFIQRYLVTLRVPRFTSQATVAANYSGSPGYLPSFTSWFNEFSLGEDAGNDGVGNYGVHRAAGDATFAPAGTIANNQFYVMSLVIKSTGQSPANFAIYQNSAPLSVIGDLADANTARGPRSLGWLDAGQYPQGTANSLGSFELRIGSFVDSSLNPSLATTDFNVGNVWNGDIGEVIIYSAELSDSDRGKVEDYLTAKYGVGGRPHLATTPTLPQGAIISYPISSGTTSLGTYLLETTTNLNPPTSWTQIAPSIVGTQYTYTNTAAAQAFYRLHLLQ